MQRFFGIAQDVNGNVIPSCTVRVRLASTATDATLFSDNAYTPLANPMTSEVDGAYQFYARDGRYDIVLTKTGYTFDDDDTANILLADSQSVISPAQIISNQNDYSPTNALAASTWRINSDAERTITGIAAGNSQQFITLTNIGSFTIMLAHQSSLSVAANRFQTPSSAAYALQANNSVMLVYDTTSAYWRVLGQQLPVILSRQVATQTVTNSAAETSVYSFSVPSNVMGTTRSLRLTWHGTHDNNNATPPSLTVRYKFGGTTFHDGAITAITASASTRPVWGWAIISPNNSATAQRSHGRFSLGAATTAGQTAAIAAGHDVLSFHNTLAIDTTATVTLQMTVQHGVADTVTTFRLQNVTLELL